MFKIQGYHYERNIVEMGEEERKMILAEYSIRSKQEYIFRTNRLLEIVGASEIIAKIWDVFFEVAENQGIKIERAKNNEFKFEEICKKFKDGSLGAVELFCGGGNVSLLFASKTVFGKMNKAFSYIVLDKYPGIVPMVAFCESEGKNGSFEKDFRKLRKNSDNKKNVMSPQWDIFTVPFAMTDGNSFLPCCKKVKIASGKLVPMSKESYVKYREGRKIADEEEEVKKLDVMVTRRGVESLLAVVHVDGNNMGLKIAKVFRGAKTYNIAIPRMREFVATTSDCFENSWMEALNIRKEELQLKFKEEIQRDILKGSSFSYRRIVGSADDVTFICNARFALDYTDAYLKMVNNYHSNHESKWKYSCCAGICIFQSHYPFSLAYKMAEQACNDGAKKKVHPNGDASGAIEEGWVDFHFLHGGMVGDLGVIRDSQGTRECMARPWLISWSTKDIRAQEKAEKEKFSLSKMQKLKECLEKRRADGSFVSRTAIKTISSAFERSEAAAREELLTLYGHTPGLENDIKELFLDEKGLLRAFYDFAEVYDLWFSGVKK